MSKENKKYPGTLLTTFYPTSGGKQARCYTLGPYESKAGKSGDSLKDLIAKLQAAGPGCKLVIKDAPAGFRADSNGNEPRHILEVLTAEELAAERDRMKANDDSAL
jgi:hypothetical protein